MPWFAFIVRVVISDYWACDLLILIQLKTQNSGIEENRLWTISMNMEYGRERPRNHSSSEPTIQQYIENKQRNGQGKKTNI